MTSRCRRIRSWIVRSVDSDLEPKEALLLGRHLTSCTACRIVLARETRLTDVLGAMTDPLEVDERFFESVMASLPDLPPRPPVEVSRKVRWRRGLRLAMWASVAALGAGVLARVLPALRIDVAAPVLPRFAPDETGGWISIVGAVAQWVRMTAQSVSVAGSSGGIGALTVGALSCGFVAGAATILALSAALAWAKRASSRLS